MNPAGHTAHRDLSETKWAHCKFCCYTLV